MPFYSFLIIFIVQLKFVLPFWPPAYKVDLEDEKVFVIESEGLNYGEENEDDDAADEMIREEDLKEFKSLINDDEDKFKPLHSHVESYNKRSAITATEFAQVFPKIFQYGIGKGIEGVEELEPFIDGFKNELEEYDFNDLEERVYQVVRKKRNDGGNLDSTAQTLASDDHGTPNPTIGVNGKLDSTTLGDKDPEDKVKGESEDLEKNNDNEKGDETLEEEYDYHKFKSEYYEEIENLKSDNKTFNYTDTGAAEESAKDAIKKIVDFKMPKNCTKEELTQFGAKALECLAYDYKTARKDVRNVKKILTRTWLVLRIWVLVYLLIAIPCWCQKGWCCCCFYNFAFCKPKEIIRNSKKYYAENPPGILNEYKEIEDGSAKGEFQATEFEPTLFELEAFERFESAIRNL